MKQILNNDIDSPGRQLQFVLQASRTIAHNDRKVPPQNKIPAQIAKFIEIDWRGNVTMTCPRLFQECASEIANSQIERQIDENDKGKTRPKGGISAQL